MDRRSVIKNAGIAGVLSAGIAPADVDTLWVFTFGYRFAPDGKKVRVCRKCGADV